MTDPFDRNLPPDGSDLDMKDLRGCAAIIIVGGCHVAVPTKFGVKAGIRCTVVILNGPDEGKEYTDALLFNSKVVRKLRGAPSGTPYVVHVDVDETGTNPMVVLMDPDAGETELARAWFRDDPAHYEELLKLTVASFDGQEAMMSQSGQAAQQQQRPAQQQRSAPPSSPPRAPANQAPSSPPPLANDGPPRPQSRAENYTKPHEDPWSEEPPF